MRVSTSQFYFQSAQLMNKKSAEVNEQMGQISTGKRINSAKDDAVSYGTLAGLNDGLANIEKYKRNLNQAESHNSLQDVIFSNAEDILSNIKDKMLQANNGARSSDDLQAIASEIKSNLEHFLELANTQNENGDYIYSGFQTQQKPFSQQVDGSVTYNGDNGVNELQIARNIDIATNQPGDDAFLNVNNSQGDFAASYPTTPVNTSGIQLESAIITDREAYNAAVPPTGYTFNFDSLTGELSVTEDITGDVAYPAAPLTSAPYVAGQTISFDGVEVTLSGNPLPGESISISEQENVSIFENINDAISWLEQGVLPTGKEQHQVEYNAILDQLSTSVKHITSRRVESGIRLQAIDSQVSRHLDAELNLATNKSSIEDLDIAKAITEFEQSQVALQASQQVFSRVQGLSLFNYL